MLRTGLNEKKVIELLKDLTNILGAFSIKQLFHSGLLDMRSALRACLAIYLTNRFHVAVRLFSNRSQMTSKCGKNKKVAHEAQPSVSLMFLPHFDVLCDLLLNRRTATWNLFVFYNTLINLGAILLVTSCHVVENLQYSYPHLRLYLSSNCFRGKET